MAAMAADDKSWVSKTQGSLFVIFTQNKCYSVLPPGVTLVLLYLPGPVVTAYRTVLHSTVLDETSLQTPLCLA